MAARIGKNDFEAKVLKSNNPVVVDFYSDSCASCKMLSPVLGNLEDNYEDKIDVVKVNTNFEAELAEQYSIMANPTVVIFKDGQEVGRKTGFIAYNDLEKWATEYL